MELTNELIEKEEGAYKASLLADKIDGQFHSVSFGIVTRDGIPLDLTLRLTPFGLEHDYDGVDKDEVDEIVGLLEAKLAQKFGLTFEERPQSEDMVQEPIQGDNINSQTEET
jgi:hypothetical protein